MEFCIMVDAYAADEERCKANCACPNRNDYVEEFFVVSIDYIG